MRPSPLRHPLAILRITIGLTQGELAKLVKRSARTIQAVELNKLPLSQELALLVAQETGVDAAWLMEGNPTTSPRKGAAALWDRKKGDYDKQFFQMHRAFVESPFSPVEEVLARLPGGMPGSERDDAVRSLWIDATEKIDPTAVAMAKRLLKVAQTQILGRADQPLHDGLKQILEQSAGTERYALVRWKLRRFLEDLAKENSLTLSVAPVPESAAVPPASRIRVIGGFKFSPPAGWSEAERAGVLIFHSSQRALFCAHTVWSANEGDEAERLRCQRIQQLLVNAKAKGFRITKEAALDHRTSTKCWTGEAESLDGGQCHYQSTFRNGMETLFASMDASNSAEARLEYETFVRSVEINAECAVAP